MTDNYHSHMHRRHTSKVGYRVEKNNILEANNLPRKYQCLKNFNITLIKNKSKRKGRVSKIRLRNPSNFKQNVLDDATMARLIKTKAQKRERNKSQEGLMTINKNSKNYLKTSEGSAMT
jgi:hypothetical protein